MEEFWIPKGAGNSREQIAERCKAADLRVDDLRMRACLERTFAKATAVNSVQWQSVTKKVDPNIEWARKLLHVKA